MRLKNIRFIFENCDVITIDGKYIGNFLIDDIRTTIGRSAVNFIGKMETAYTIVIEIHKDANKERHALGLPELNQLTFDRFTKWNDITAVEFELEEQYVEDGQAPKVEYYHYYTNWVGDNEYENDAQSAYISENGDLYLVIDKNKQIRDYFDYEEIDDEKYSYWHWDLLMDERWL